MKKILFTLLTLFICVAGYYYFKSNTKKSSVNNKKHYSCCGGFKSPVKAYDLGISVSKIKDNVFNQTIFEYAAETYKKLVNYDYSDGVSHTYVADKTLDLLKAYFAGCKKEMYGNNILNPETALKYLSDSEICNMLAFKDMGNKYFEVYENALHFFLLNGNESRYKKAVEYNEKIISHIGKAQFRRLLNAKNEIRTNLIKMLALSYKKAGKQNHFISLLLNEP